MRILSSITILSVVLLAAGCASQQKHNLPTGNKAGTPSAQDESLSRLNQQLSTDLKGDPVTITQLNNQLKVTLANAVLFPEGGWTLSQKGEQTLARIAPTLASLRSEQVLVESFTDNVPIGPALRQRFPSNWELSTARATDVRRFLVARGVPKYIVSAQGSGDLRPVATNDTAAGRGQNRRVEIIITSRRP